MLLELKEMHASMTIFEVPFIAAVSRYRDRKKAARRLDAEER